MSRRYVLVCALLSWSASLFALSTSEQPGEVVLDDFNAQDIWSAEGTDEVGAGLRWIDAAKGRAMCLDYDFSRASGFASARRALALKFPDDYEFRFSLRGTGKPNHLQLKLVDASGENVWWVSRPEFSAPEDWQPQRFKKRHIDFAWGPSADKTLRQSASIELTVAAGSGGGSGNVCIDQIRFIERALPASPPPAPTLTSLPSSALAQLAKALDDSQETAWESTSSKPQHLTLDLGQSREFGGLMLRWLPGLAARDYRISASDDGDVWRVVGEIEGSDGGVDPIPLPEAEARYLRIELLRAQGKHYALADLQLQDLAFGANPNAMLMALAKEAPRGDYPRGFSGEQTYWTVLGLNGGGAQALLSEDGAIEPYRGSFSVEPMLFVAGQRLSWADARITHSLMDGDLPIPSVHWQLPNELNMDITAFADGTAERPYLLARYALRNSGKSAQDLVFVLAARPLQVNPPVQFLNTPGGVSPIRTLEMTAQRVRINAHDAIFAARTADAVAARGFAHGALFDWLTPLLSGTFPRRRPAAIDDPAALASGVLLYRLKLAPGQSWETGALLPMTASDTQSAELAKNLSPQWLQSRQTAVAAKWRKLLDRTRVDVAAEPELGATLRTAAAHILINRNGPSIQPGTRSYARSWIRDGAMTSGALMRVGHSDVARAFLDWYLPYQFDSGKVPCCVDKRGADPVPENDSHGELIHLIHELYRYDHDIDGLRRRWPTVTAAVAYMDTLRDGERSSKNQSDERRAYYGLLPPSISHEGYSDRPAYSYWDGFWGLLGYKDAAAIAGELGETKAARHITAARDEYRADLYASLRNAMAHHRIDYLPGAADRGDFDATSTTIALAPGGEQAALPAAALQATFERYWKNFEARRAGAADAAVYTPYEWRVVGTFVRLGWRERALQAMDFFMADRRPAAWNQWAEVVDRDVRRTRFIGDMPHGWVASDFIRSTLDLFVYEREADTSLVIAAGVPESWRGGEGVSVQQVHTPYGPLSYRLQQNALGEISMDIETGLDIPPGGLRWPIANARLLGDEKQGVTRDGGEWVITRLPQTLHLERRVQ
jgi:hypothetical protein